MNLIRTFFFSKKNFLFRNEGNSFAIKFKENATYFAHFSSRKMQILCQNFLARLARTLHLLICSLSTCIHYFPNRGIFPNRGKRGVLFHVQTEEWPKPRDVYKCIFTAYFHLSLNEEPTSERRNPTDSLNIHCTTFFRQENKRCAAS